MPLHAHIKEHPAYFHRFDAVGTPTVLIRSHVLGEMPQQFRQRYPDSIWAMKTAAWEH